MALGLLKLQQKSEINITSWVIVGYLEIDKLDDKIDVSAFGWLPVSSAVHRFGNERRLDNCMNFEHPKDKLQEG